MIPDRYRPLVIGLIGLGLPLIGANLARMAIGVTDTVIVGRYGVEPLAALVLATSYHFVLFMLGSGYGIALMGVIAAAMAQGDDTRVRRCTRMVFWLSGLHAIVVLPVLWFSGPILLALGQQPQIAGLAQDFLRIYGFSMAPMLWGLVLNSYLAALGRPQVVLWVTLAGLPVNAALNWMLVFGNWGAPEMGVRGSAVASLTVTMLQLVILVAYALWLPRARHFRLAQNLWKPDWADFRQMFRLGLPVGVTLVAETGMFAGGNVLMGWLGPRVLAAHGIALQLSALAFMVHLGLASAATIRVGEAAGRGDLGLIRALGRSVIGVSATVAVMTATLFMVIPRWLGGLYLDPAAPETPEILGLIALLLFWAGLFQIADAMQAVALGLLRGIQDTRGPMVIAAVAYWLVGMPAAYVAAFPLGFGPQGVWFGLLAGLATAAALLMRRFWGGEARGDWTRAAAAA